MPDLKIDWEKLVDDVADDGRAALKDWLEGAEEDLKAFGKEISKNAIDALRQGRPDLLDMLRHQARTIAEGHRIHLNSIAWEQATNVLLKIASTAVKAVARVSIL